MKKDAETQRSSAPATEVRGRAFKIGMAPATLSRIQQASLNTRYKGAALIKNPFDLVLYLRLLERLRPRTIIEVGSYQGGSALWLRDQCRALGIETSIISLDVSPPILAADGTEFAFGDALRANETFPRNAIEASPHPWLVIDDSAHTYECCSAILCYFSGLMCPGDYLVVEDGSCANLPQAEYGHLDDGPNRAVRDFLNYTGEAYEIDADLCDFFGHNVTWCPNAWLVRAR